MALFTYQAFNKAGKKVGGTIDAPSIAGAREQLAKQGLYPISIAAGQSSGRFEFLTRLFRPSLSTKDKIVFTNQLAVLLRSGVPLLQALELLVDHFEGPLHTILVGVKDDLREGVSLADALKKYPRAFDTIYVQLVRAGEASGKLEMILERLATFLERREEIAKRVSGALFYPMIQLSVALLVVIVLLVKVVPQMGEMFAGQGKELPGATEFLLNLSGALTNHYVAILVFIALVLVGFAYWRQTESGALTIDKLKLRIPLVRYFSRTNAVVQFCYTLGILIENGVNLAESLDIVCKIIDNKVLAKALSDARDKIIKQGKISQYLKQTNLFPPMALYLINTGEESGKLDAMLLTVARNYEEDLKEISDKLSASLGPILLVVMALVVGFIIYSVMVPIMGMSELVAGGIA